MRKFIDDRRVLWGIMVTSTLLLFAAGCAHWRTFPTLDVAPISSLIDALRRRPEATEGIFGSSESGLLSSDDAVCLDQNNTELFLSKYDEKHGLVPGDNGAMTGWSLEPTTGPCPFRSEKDQNKDAWQLDTAAARMEIINRRIGRMSTRRDSAGLPGIVDAARDTRWKAPTTVFPPTPKVHERSRPKNGLYWPTARRSPVRSTSGGHRPRARLPPHCRHTRRAALYLGYNYRMLSAPGHNANGEFRITWSVKK